MKTISSWNDLAPFGIEFLTGESCGLGWRILCDVTANGKRVLEKCFGIPNMALAENWNRGGEQGPHVGSIMLTPEMYTPVAVFALLESDCKEVWLYENGNLRGISPSDPPDQVAAWDQVAPDALVRKFSYKGTAGDRNVHLMSGRVE